MTKNVRNASIISLFVLFIVEFYHLSFFPDRLFYGILRIVCYILPMFFLAKTMIWEGPFLGKKLFACYFCFSIINIISCYFYRSQSPYISFIAWCQLYYVFYYLTFRTWKQSIEVWEKVVEFMYITLLVLFVLKNAFLDWDFIKTDLSYERLEVEKRVRIFSDAFLELGYLYCLNKYMVLKKTKYLLLSLLGAFFIFLQGFRMMILMGILVSFILLIRVYKLSFRSLILTLLTISLSAILAFQALQFRIVRDRLDEIVNRNENANFANEDYVRVRDINYTYTSFFHNRIEMFFGAGKTLFWNLNYTKSRSSYPSKYSKERTMLATNNGYYPADWGFLGLSWETGIPFAIVTIILFLYLWKFKVDKDYYYLSCFGLYMVLIGVTNAQGYYQANLICLALAYTMVEIAHKLYRVKDIYQKMGRRRLLNKKVITM